MHQMTPIAAGLASLGRGDDKMLVHMTPGEVQGLQALAMAHGGSLTINPQTGLPEAGFLSDLLPSIVGIGLSLINPGLSPWIIGGATGLTALATGKDLGTALTSGLLSGAGSALFGPGAEAVGTTPPPVAEVGAGSAAANATFNPEYALNAPPTGVPQYSAYNIPSSPAPNYSLSSGIPGEGFRTPVGGEAMGYQTSPIAYPGEDYLGGSATYTTDYNPINGGIRPAQLTPNLNVSPTTATVPTVAKPGFMQDPIAWMSQNRGKTALLGLGALGALGGLKQQPLNVPALPQQGGVNYRPQGMNVRPYDPTAPGGYYFTDRGFPQAVYAARGGVMSSVPELEDGGFVLTKKAVDGIGKGSNERGQRAAAAGLGAIPIRGPGTGTSDSIPTTIDGRRPALVSNGEAYVPRNQVKRRGGAKKFYALMRQAEQAAARQV